MWIIATEDLSDFIPQNKRYGGQTLVDVSSKGLPRLFSTKAGASIALGHWFNGPYHGEYDEDQGGWIYHRKTDAARRAVWDGRLGARQVSLVSSGCP